MRIQRTPEQRAHRLVELYKLRTKVMLEIAAIESEMDREAEAIKRAKEAAMRFNLPIGKRPQALCGTDSGYYRHRRKHNEEPCEACRLAHRNAERMRTRAKREQEAVA